MKIKIRVKSLFMILMLLIMFMSELFMYNIKILSYTDETIACLCVLVLVFHLLCGRKSKDFKCLIIILILTILGLVSNVFSGLSFSLFNIIVDWLSCFKFFIVLFTLRLVITKRNVEDIVKFFIPLAKIFIWAAFILGIITLFYDTGMRGQERFGLPGYTFIFKYTHIFVTYLLFMLGVIILSKASVHTKFKYVVLCMVIQILTTKGPSIIWVAAFWLIYFTIGKKRKLKIWTIILLVIASVVLGGYQINNYLSNVNAPRYLFFYYGAVTALRYFPFGAGFGKFGSNVAFTSYSELYRNYGFDGRYGMNELDGSFMNDDYWPMVVGQFGFLGVIAFAYLYWYIFKILNNLNVDGLVKTFSLSFILYFYIHTLGNAIMTSSASLVVAFMLVMLCKYNDEIVLK